MFVYGSEKYLKTISLAKYFIFHCKARLGEHSSSWFKFLDFVATVSHFTAASTAQQNSHHFH